MNTFDLVKRKNLSSTNHLLMALVIALLLHLTLFLTWNFKMPTAKPKALLRTLEVTLVRHTPEQDRPEKADVLAQEDQIASAPESTVQEALSAPQPAAEQTPSKPDVKQAQQESKARKQTAAAKPQMVSQQPAEEKVLPSEVVETTVAQQRLRPDLLAQQISQVSSQVTELMNRKTSSKKVAYVGTINAHKYKAAAYEKAWQDKVERIGNMNYPEVARKGKLSGNLELAVGINRDGSIYRIDVLRSSGHKKLDEAATNIVRLAAPFAALPDGVRDEVDILFIKRRWIFSEDQLSTGSRS